MSNREQCFAFKLNDPSVLVCCGFREGVCLALGIHSQNKSLYSWLHIQLQILGGSPPVKKLPL